MLKVIIDQEDGWNEQLDRFEPILPRVVIDLEHSLISVSKWESEHQKPFLARGEKTNDELLSYIRHMVLTSDWDPNVMKRFSQSTFLGIQQYIDSPQSATTFGSMPDTKGPGETITAELIYYWMVGFRIPFECQYWHLNRLFALIRICNVKNSKPKRKSNQEMAEERNRINAERRAKYGTTG